MDDIKELAKWLADEVEFLKANQEYTGGWYDLGNGLGAVVLWEEGWGDEKRDDCIQATNHPDWALCAGIMLINKDDTPDGWYMPWDSKTGDILCETTGIEPEEDYEKLAQSLLDDYNYVKDADIKPNGETIFADAEDEHEVEVPSGGTEHREMPWDYSKDESCDKKSIKEEKEYSTSPYKDVIAEYFDYSGDFEFLDIVASCLGRISNYEDDEDIYQSVDDELIYTYDQWKVIEHYCTPQEANWEDAYSDFMNDIFAICSTIGGMNHKEDDNMEEPTNKDESLKEDIDVSKVDLDKIIGWISDHKELYDDFKKFFNYDYDVARGKETNKPSKYEVLDWLSEHDDEFEYGDSVWSDFKSYFKIKDESLRERYSSDSHYIVTYDEFGERIGDQGWESYEDAKKHFNIICENGPYEGVFSVELYDNRTGKLLDSWEYDGEIEEEPEEGEED